jgi:hypothetical protein
VVRLQFKSFGIEQGYDSLWLYNGSSTASPLIGGYTGTISPGTVVSTGTALTLRYKSDGATVSFGFKANHTCIPAVTTGFVNQALHQKLDVFPNPISSGGKLNIASSEELKTIRLMDVTGKLLKEFSSTQEISLPQLSSGIYLLKTDNYPPVKLVVEE